MFKENQEKKNEKQMAAIRFCTLKNLMPNVCINIMSKNKTLKCSYLFIYNFCTLSRSIEFIGFRKN